MVWAVDTSTFDVHGALRLSGILTFTAPLAHPLKLGRKAIRQTLVSTLNPLNFLLLVLLLLPNALRLLRDAIHGLSRHRGNPTL